MIIRYPFLSMCLVVLGTVYINTHFNSIYAVGYLFIWFVYTLMVITEFKQ